MEEILSVGEKIRRTRVYKGYTLKDLCDNKLSVSKLSCIENDKIKPDIETLEYISDKLDININFLRYGIREQLEYNIKQFQEEKLKDDIEKLMLYNLKISEEYKYYDIAYKIVRIIFNYYIKIKNNNKAQDVISKYFDLCIKSHDLNNTILYFVDMGKYSFLNKEYTEAAENFKNARLYCNNKKFDSELYTKIVLNEAKCYLMAENFEDIQLVGEILEKYKDKINDTKVRAKIYHILALVMYLKNDSKYKNYEKELSEFYKEDNKNKAIYYYNKSFIHFKKDEKNEGFRCLEKAKKLFPKNDLDQFIVLLFSNLKMLYKYNMLKTSGEIIEETLDYSIKLDKPVYIEKGYYYKSVFLFETGNITSAEMYMNLSLGLYEKFASKQERYDRYIKVGNIYYKLGMKNDALKYFGIGTSLHHKL